MFSPIIFELDEWSNLNIFQGVADPNEKAYLTNLCSKPSSLPSILFFILSLFSSLDIDRIQADAARGNTPLWFGGTFMFFNSILVLAQPNS